MGRYESMREHVLRYAIAVQEAMIQEHTFHTALHALGGVGDAGAGVSEKRIGGAVLAQLRHRRALVGITHPFAGRCKRRNSR